MRQHEPALRLRQIDARYLQVMQAAARGAGVRVAAGLTPEAIDDAWTRPAASSTDWTAFVRRRQRWRNKRWSWHTWAECAALGGYRIASQAGSIVATRDSDVGSIGTFWQWFDTLAAFEAQGVRSVLLTTGAFKGVGAQGEPITDDQRAFLQEMTDKTNDQMLQDIKAGRGFSDEQVAAVADGRFWLAADALTLGLIDGIGSRQETLQRIRASIRKSGPKTSSMSRSA